MLSRLHYPLDALSNVLVVRYEVGLHHFQCDLKVLFWSLVVLGVHEVRAVRVGVGDRRLDLRAFVPFVEAGNRDDISLNQIFRLLASSRMNVTLEVCAILKCSL